MLLQINLAGLGTFTFFVFGIHGAVGYFRSWRYYKTMSCCGEKETEVDKRGVRLEANYHNDQANQVHAIGITIRTLGLSHLLMYECMF